MSVVVGSNYVVFVFVGAFVRAGFFFNFGLPDSFLELNFFFSLDLNALYASSVPQNLSQNPVGNSN